jgi:HAD hydrolase, family IA, variant 1
MDNVKRMIREYDTYIFDLDGTLLDTLTDLAASCNYALLQHGMAQRTIDEVRMFVGNGVKKLMERAIPDGLANPQFDEVYQCFRQHYLKHGLDHTAPYPAVLPMLAELKRRNKKIAVVSNKFYRATEELCKHFFDQYVEVAIGEREGIKKKPAPDTVMEALAQLGVTGDNAVYIGDSDVDIATANNCQLPCISVLWGFRDKDFLLRSGATTLINTPEELLV